MRIRAKQKLAAKATTLGARVPQAQLFVMETGNISNWIIIIEKTNKKKGSYRKCAKHTKIKIEFVE